MNESEMSSFMEEFDSVIHPTVTGITGEPPDIDNNGKLFIIVTDIRDRVYHGQQGDITGGYFWPLHGVVNTGESVYYYSNESEIFRFNQEENRNHDSTFFSFINYFSIDYWFPPGTGLSRQTPLDSFLPSGNLFYKD